jgi:hypothetical protein
MKELNMDIESEVLSAVAKKSWGYSATQSSQSQHDIFQEHRRACFQLVADFLPGLFVDTDDGSGMIFRNFG